MKYPILYKRTVTGAIQQWQIQVEDNKFRTIEGQLGGKLTTSEWTECESKNVGRANETTPVQQVIREAESRIQKKKDEGYTQDVDKVDESKIFQPMLAEKYEKGKVEFPVYCQPKLDGIRCITRKEGLFTRRGKPIVSVPHIWETISHLFDEFPDIILDGELYNHELREDFNKIVSIVRKTNLTEKDVEESSKLAQYHIYDIDFIEDKLDFTARNVIIRELFADYDHNDPIRLVSTGYCMNDDELDDLYKEYLEKGYEGQMVRIDKHYQNKRSKYLLKRKEFIDEEFIILDVEEGVGNRSGMMGRIKFKTKDGKSFCSSARGNEEFYRDLLKNKNIYIGKTATVRYQNFTPDGIPRFPVAVAIRDYE